MTAFARAQRQVEASQLCWEIRSVNHRYLDVSFRLPEAFRFLEPQLRNALKNTIYRGKLECQLKYQDNNAENQSMLINIGIVNALMDLSAKLASSHHLANDLGVSKVLGWPGVMQAPQCNMDNLGPDILSLFHEGLGQLSDARASEGSALKELIQTRLNALRDEVSRAQSCVKTLALTSKDRLLNRLQAMKLDVPEGRLEQEMALILARMDVSEELDRLQTHTVEVQRALDSEHSAGRRLDFLMQELNREANTLSSKSDSAELTQTAIEMKVLIEQMREQIQNIE
jgi:uncharacterized protein (TIGR00255 family)